MGAVVTVTDGAAVVVVAGSAVVVGDSVVVVVVPSDRAKLPAWPYQKIGVADSPELPLAQLASNLSEPGTACCGMASWLLHVPFAATEMVPVSSRSAVGAGPEGTALTPWNRKTWALTPPTAEQPVPDTVTCPPGPPEPGLIVNTGGTTAWADSVAPAATLAIRSTATPTPSSRRARKEPDVSDIDSPGRSGRRASVG